LLGRLIASLGRATVKAEPGLAVFIAEALELCLAKKYRVPAPLADAFRRLGLGAIDDEIELHARQAIGLCLGRLGDPRIASLRDPSAYVEVPAGTYPYGEKKMLVTIAAPFRLGRYPVTNSQFGEFLDDKGYETRQWWSKASWAWLQQEGVTEPALWRDRRWNGPNRPVVGVSFWEADACSRWAHGRLPSEQEWEAAARGPAGLEYPWGSDWEDGICNSFEAGLGVTSPVGLFPRARWGVFGIEDLAGNVWEWCDSFYDRSDKNWPEARVVRGGSWLDGRDGARAASRGRGLPGFRDGGLGFRVVCSSPILDH
jgi:formylglycine-generating enzyme required for sulfatase activity